MLNDDTDVFPPTSVLEFVRGPFDGEEREVPGGAFTYVPWTATNELICGGYYFRAFALTRRKEYKHVMLWKPGR